MTKSLKDRELEARDRFVADTTEHELAVLHDDGLYRHLRLSKPGTSMYYFDLITWPGVLTVNGDMGTWTFSRERDMFEFFRSGHGLTRINSGYWGEKLKAGTSGGNRHAADYCSDIFEEIVRERVAEFTEHCDWPAAVVETLHAHIEAEIFEGYGGWAWEYSESEAHRALAECRFRETTDGHTYEFEFVDSWEHTLTAPSTHFLWVCWAIVHGINAYDAAKAAAA